MEIKQNSCLEINNGSSTAGPVIGSLSVLLVAVESRVVAQPASVWLMSLGAVVLAKAQSAMMFTPSKEL